ncbi:MAG: transporter permease [Conexibacter sp.]|nr:transporter permease [Conexibacter sp.]
MKALVVSTAALLRLVGLRHLRRRWRRTLLTALGIASGVALVVSVAITYTTLERAIDSTALGAGQERTLIVRAAGAPSLDQRAAKAAREVPGVAAAVPIIRQISTVRHGGRRVRTLFLGTSSGGARAADGRTVRPLTAADGLLLSAALARRLSAWIGSAVVVETPDGPAEVPVTAIVRPTSGTAVNGGVYAVLSLSLAQRLFGRPGRLDAIAVRVRQDADEEVVRGLLARSLGPSVSVVSSEDLAAPFKRTFSAIVLTTRLVSLLALLVAILLVLNTQSMALTERHREICLLRLAGARPLPFVLAFVAEAALVGLVAGAVGVEAGAHLAQAKLDDARSAYATALPFTAVGPVSVSLWQALAGVACGALVAAGGALLTVRRILAIRPIELLRPKPAYAIAASEDHRPVSVPGVVGLLTILGTLALTTTTAAAGSAVLDAAGLLAMVAGGALLLPSFVRTTSDALRRGVLDRIGPIGWLAGGGIARAPSRTIFAVGALAMSATVALASGSAIGSFESATRSAVEGWYPAPIYARAPGVGVRGTDQPVNVAVGRRLATVDGVRAVYPGRVAVADQAREHLSIIVLPFAAAARHGVTLTQDVPAGDTRLVGAMASGSVLVSRPLASRLGLSPGGRLTLRTARGVRRFMVAGTFESINPTGEIYMDRSVFRQVMDDDRADFFAVSLRPGANVDATVARLTRFVERQHIPLQVMTRAQTRQQVIGTVSGVFAMANVIRITALVVVGLTVAATMLTAMFERQREIGLLRLVGMSRLRFVACVVLEAVCLTGMAGLLAIGLGLGAGYLILSAAANRLGMHLPFDPGLATIGAAILYTMLPACLAAIYTGWRCSRSAITVLLAPRA